MFMFKIDEEYKQILINNMVSYFSIWEYKISSNWPSPLT